jgi:DNA-directed RNA polymerase subunit M/transcription elongation factor TFIIS
MKYEKTGREASQTVGIGRRTAIKSLALGGLIASAGWRLTGAADAAPEPNAAAPAQPGTAPNAQVGWRWCPKCEGMFYAVASAGKGVCPAGGAHVDSGSAHYIATEGEDATGRQQGGWRWCPKCEGMFYARASAGKGVCPAGGKHDDSGSAHYAAIIGEDVSGKQQGGWRWCHKCEGMFYARASAGKGVCPAGSKHDDGGSAHYALRLGA